MRTVFLTLLAVIVLVVAGGFGFIYSGIYNIAAIEPHWPITHWAIETGRTRSIQVHAANSTVPPRLDDPAKISMGMEHFAAHCAACHGAPGVPRGDIAKGLYPPPPDLTKVAQHYTPAELFWIVKNGIKSTGMPSWSDHSDDELWGAVAFVEKLPGMSEEDYRKLVMASISLGGGHHTHGGDMPMDHQSMPGMAMPAIEAPEKPDAHQH